MNIIFSKKNYLIFSLLYTSFRFLLNNKNERITQFIFFTISFVYLFVIFKDNYKRFLNKNLIISYLIIIFAIISTAINKTFDFVSVRVIFMLIINFVALIIDDPHDTNYKRTFDTIVNLILFVCIVHNVLCLVLMVTDLLKISNIGVFVLGRLRGFTYFSGTGEIGLIGLGSSIYYLESTKEKYTSKFYISAFLLFTINIITIVLAQSRCSLYSMFFCLTIYIILKSFIEDRQNKFIAVAKTILVLLIFIIVVYLVLYKLRIFKIRKFSFVSIERLDIWYAYLMVLLNENVLLGLGASRFVEVFRNVLGDNQLSAYVTYFGNNELGTKVYEINNYFAELLPHNEYIRHMVIFGIAGLFLVIVFLVNAFIKLVMIFKLSFKENRCIIYLSIFYFIFPLISGLVENMLSFSNSPRFLENFTIFFIIGYINLIYEKIRL